MTPPRPLNHITRCLQEVVICLTTTPMSPTATPIPLDQCSHQQALSPQPHDLETQFSQQECCVKEQQEQQRISPSTLNMV